MSSLCHIQVEMYSKYLAVEISTLEEGSEWEAQMSFPHIGGNWSFCETENTQGENV